ncbi:MAG: hypothetical protein J6C23_01060 [Clostridia bacterium]|nr:hypothetical protein [Clostridia bacterium]
MQLSFENSRSVLEKEFTQTEWLENSGLNPDDVVKAVEGIENQYSSKAIIKAKTFEFIASNALIAVDKFNIFQDKLQGSSIMAKQRSKWQKQVIDEHLSQEAGDIYEAWQGCGAYHAHSDFGHTSPNSKLLLNVGISGLLQRVEEAENKGGLTDKQKDFYLSCKIMLKSMQTVAHRLADAIEPYNTDNATALRNIAKDKPQNTYEAMQLLVLYFFLHEYVGGTRVRTLGIVDALLYPFYKKDIEEGVYTKEQIKEMLKYFLFKFWSAKVPYDLPFCLAGLDENENSIVNELSYLIVETYNELNIYSPKIHIRVSDKTPREFIMLVLSCIRGGNSSFVLVNDHVAIKSLERVGISHKDAVNYVPIGCYEPAVWGVEIGCTGNGGINLGKAIEYIFNNGVDHRNNKVMGAPVGKISTYEDFVREVKKQIANMTDRCVHFINAIEGYYGEINPDPMLSCQYDESIKRGVDVYEGGAKYNNTSLYFYCLASLVDSICAVKKFVFDEKIVSFDKLGEILRNNWEGNEELQLKARAIDEKYGNSNAVADKFTVEFAEYCSSLLLNRPNGRGGVYKPACFTIDHYVHIGAKTLATPDGRKLGEPLSKNLCASIGMDKTGITSLINSVTSFDHSLFPTGSVLDVVLHPSAVSGDNGLNAFYGILKTYFAKGGFAMHGNVFDSKMLKEAQAHPENYKNLQVRVCGWNAYFVNLSKAEQDAFIKQSELND